MCQNENKDYVINNGVNVQKRTKQKYIHWRL